MDTKAIVQEYPEGKPVVLLLDSEFDKLTGYTRSEVVPPTKFVEGSVDNVSE